MAHRAMRPGKIVFLADDPLIQSPRLPRMAPDTLVFAEGSLKDVASALEPTARNRQVQFHFETKPGETALHDLTEFAELFCLVNAQLQPSIPASESQRLLDYLFMPDLPNWDALLHGLDFKRSMSTEARRSVDDFIADNDQRQPPPPAAWPVRIWEDHGTQAPCA